MRACDLFKDPNDNTKNICRLCGRIFIHETPCNKIFLVCHNQEGLTIVQPEIVDLVQKNNKEMQIVQKEKPKVEMPSVGSMAKNAIKALGAFVANPTTVTKEEYEARLTVCSSCDKYDDVGNRCGVCGCYLALKAKGAAFHCPLKKWPGDT